MTTPLSPDEDELQRISLNLTGDAAEDKETFFRWLEETSARRALYDELRAIWVRARSPHAWNTAAAIRRVREAHSERVMAGRVEGAPLAVAQPSGRFARRLQGNFSRNLRGYALRAAAVLIAAIGLSTILWHIAMRTPELAVATAPAVREVTTLPGQRATLKLADGTRIILGASSTLRYPVYFDTSASHSRIVQLEGMAYFDVVHDALHPFIVRTSQAVAHDIGTKFVVRAYEDMARVDVVVTEGAVALASTESPVWQATGATNADSLVLHARDHGQVGTAGHLRVERNVDITQSLAWTTGTLVFKNTPVRDVIAEARRWYGVDIRVVPPSQANDLLDRVRLTATYTTEPVSVLVKELAAVLGARTEHVGKQVILYVPSARR